MSWKGGVGAAWATGGGRHYGKWQNDKEIKKLSIVDEKKIWISAFEGKWAVNSPAPPPTPTHKNKTKKKNKPNKKKKKIKKKKKKQKNK